MRSIVHEILARYLGTEQHAFDASPRELWPETAYEPATEAWGPARQQPAQRERHPRVCGELEPQN